MLTKPCQIHIIKRKVETHKQLVLGFIHVSSSFNVYNLCLFTQDIVDIVTLP